MNPRERVLAIAVGSTVALLVVLWGWYQIDRMYTFRRNGIASLEKGVADQKKIERQTIAASSRMRSYQERSLPPVPSVGRSVYQSWLQDQFDKAGITQPTVTVKNGKEDKNLLMTHEFTAISKGTLPQVVKLLHQFYSADYLHRVKRLTLKPIKDSKELDITLDVEAVSLVKAPAASTLQERVASRLALPAEADYVRIISERNLFGPPNRAPQISGLGNQKAIRGRSVDIAARGSDPDNLDKVTYKLVKSGANEARLDASTGKLSWTPRTNGKYEFTVRATDDGLPAKSSKDELLVVSVEDPPLVVEPPRRLAFDDAKFTVLSAVIDVSGTGQIWLNVRPKGQTLKLGIGDKFEVGSVKGTVKEIGEGDFTFESEGKEHKLSKGGILEQAVSVPE